MADGVADDAVDGVVDGVVDDVAGDMDEHAALVALARDFSPRYECHRTSQLERRLVTIDISGLDRLLGEPAAIGEEIRRLALARHLRVHIGIAATRTTARVVALARPGITVIARGGEARVLAPIAIGILEDVHDVHDVHDVATKSPQRSLDRHHSVVSAVTAFKRWGLRTLGELAALPADALSARLGQRSLFWQTLARGQDVGPLVPSLPEERFASSIELEWPIEGLEPLSFVLTRLLEPLSTRLERRDRGAAVIHLTLGLLPVHDIQRRADDVPRSDDRARAHALALPPSLKLRRTAEARSAETGRPVQDERHVLARQTPHSALNVVNSWLNVADPDSPATYTRRLQLPTPIRDVRTLRTLLLLDLESHPPAAPIERVDIVIDPTPGRVLQHALFVRAQPTPEQMSTLIARLHALMGADRVGRSARVDSYRPGAFGMEPFPIHHAEHPSANGERPRGEPSVGDAFPADAASAAFNRRDPAINAGSAEIVSALRRYRRPVPARVVVAEGAPVAVTTDRRGVDGGQVLACAGPWRTSGEWWEEAPMKTPGKTSENASGRASGFSPGWNRDEWDVSLSDGAVYRIFQDRATQGWFIDAVVD